MFSQYVDLADVMSTIFLKNKKKQIEIYGENHANKLKKKNTFTELVPWIEKEQCLVLVEHSTLFCNLDGTPRKIEEMMLATGGGDTIFVNLTKSKYPKLVCFDNRLEDGFFNGMEESKYMKMLLSMASEMTQKNADLAGALLSKIMDKANFIINEILPKFKAPYDTLEYIEHLSLQMSILLKITDLDLTDNNIYKGIPNWSLFIQISMNLLKNIIRIGSLYVDLNLMRLIDESKEEKIVVFTGKNHLDRLFVHYSDTYDIFTTKFKFDRETSNILPVNDFDTDMSLLKSIESLLKPVSKKKSTSVNNVD